MAILAVVGPLLTPHGQFELHLQHKLRAPSRLYPLGTDELGRDLLSRLLSGARLSLGVAAAAVTLGGLLGTTSGVLGGYIGGRVDALLMRAWDVLLAFPVILLGLVVVIIFGPSALSATLAVAIINVPIFSRLARGSTLVEIGKPYLEAARALGATETRLMSRYILPNIAAPLITQAAIAAATAVLLEAAFSFLGLGVQPPNPSWGTMLQQARLYLSDNPWYGVFPGLAITMLVLGLNLVGDALRNALDPAYRR
jgi:peptide/nickel transport system permease protein